MPTRAKRRCNAPGCGKPCDGAYCDEHKREKTTAKSYDKWRGSAHSRGYNSRGNWGRLRKMVLAEHPLCQLKFKGCTEVSTVADHAIPKAAGGDDSMENLQGVCASCHGIKTRLIDPGLIADFRKRSA